MNNEKNKYSYKFLNNINNPTDLKKISISDLPELCSELRDFMVRTISNTGGHLGAGLGVVELTVALHYVYDTPKDKIIFDTGHQGYPHKILTGRRELLHTIRKKGGLSGFLKPEESEYDAYGAGHASTSISSALGIATARDILNQDYRVVAIIGDGAMTGGLAFEAMNNCGVQKRDITVILNDNNVSIDKNVSALSNYFNELFASSTVQRIRENIWELTGRLDYFGDRLRKYASKIEEGVKAIVTPGVLFEAMGFTYFGPINGNNVQKLIRMLRLIKDMHGPVLMHIVTQKGKGYLPAELDSHHLHAVGKYDLNTGKSIAKTNGKHFPSYSEIFGKTMAKICSKDKRVVCITAAMADGTGLDIVEESSPDSFFDVGIAEGHAVTFASGLASQGIIPVVAIYSTFLQRAYDNIIHDCCLPNYHVIFAIDRAGLVGEDGPTHHGVLDIVYLRTIPNMVVMAPKDEQELQDMIYNAIYNFKSGPIAIRFPRGITFGKELQHFNEIPFGKWEVLKYGYDIAILSIGKMVNQAILASEKLEKEGISAQVINARFIKPLDVEMLKQICSNYRYIITVEDGQIQGGFGSSIAEFITLGNYENINLCIHGLPDKFIEHGTQEELLRDNKLDADGIYQMIKQILPTKVNNYAII